MDLSNQSILILGAGRTGVATAEFLLGKAKKVLLSDSSEIKVTGLIEELVSQGLLFESGINSDEFVSEADLVVVSPGISPKTDIIKRLKKLSKHVISEVELASYFIDKPIIGITGTNGKSTTTELITHIINSSGKKAISCGNIGTPLISIVGEDCDYFVLELSSFQLYYSENLKCKISVCLNIVPDHLDWHSNFDEYVDSKKKLFEMQEPGSISILNGSDQLVKEFSTNGSKVLFSNSKLIKETDLQIIGEHNIENAMASMCVAESIGIKTEEVLKALKSFKGVEHRLERVDSEKLVFNDSKATNPISTVKAIQAVAGLKDNSHITLIMGGRDKRTSLDELSQLVKKHISTIYLYGEAKDRFKEEIEKFGYKNKITIVSDLNSATQESLRSKTDIILFSPACSSFDMFKNYEERGKIFKQIVHSFKEG